MIRKFICWVFGHNGICLYRKHNQWHDQTAGYEETGWKCQRCNKEWNEQYDWR